jgi:hypothetical protein
VLVGEVTLEPPLDRIVLACPRFGDVALRAVQLQLAAVDEVGERVDHAVRFPFVRHPRSGGEDDHWQTEMSVTPQMDVATHRLARDQLMLTKHDASSACKVRRRV